MTDNLLTSEIDQVTDAKIKVTRMTDIELLANRYQKTSDRLAKAYNINQ